MKKLILILGVLLLLTSASMAGNTFYAGGGADIILFGTKGSIDATPSMTVGFSVPTSTEGSISFLIPDETFLNFNYTWYQQASVETKEYQGELEGFWYLEYKEGSKFTPFFIVALGGGYESEVAGEETQSVWEMAGRFGLGSKYQIGALNRAWGFLGKTTVGFTEGVAVETALGIYFEF